MKLDLLNIFRKVYDQASETLSVKLKSNEFSIELDHRDGDSVTSHPEKLVVKVTGVDESDKDKVIIPAMDCSSLRAIKVYSENGTAIVEVSPEDQGDYFVKHDSNLPLVARRVRVRSINASGNVHLVGRS